MAKQDDETYVDQAGRRRRRHLASPEERDARDVEARKLRVKGLSFRKICAQKKRWRLTRTPRGRARLAADRAATHYERLRGRWMETATTEIGPTGERFVRWGLVGLLDAVPPPRDYVVEIHGTRRGEPSPALFAAAARRAAGPKTAPHQGP